MPDKKYKYIYRVYRISLVICSFSVSLLTIWKFYVWNGEYNGYLDFKIYSDLFSSLTGTSVLASYSLTILAVRYSKVKFNYFMIPLILNVTCRIFDLRYFWSHNQSVIMLYYGKRLIYSGILLVLCLLVIKKLAYIRYILILFCFSIAIIEIMINYSQLTSISVSIALFYAAYGFLGCVHSSKHPMISDLNLHTCSKVME